MTTCSSKMGLLSVIALFLNGSRALRWIGSEYEDYTNSQDVTGKFALIVQLVDLGQGVGCEVK
jgi:hypothetical protein